MRGPLGSGQLPAAAAVLVWSEGLYERKSGPPATQFPCESWIRRTAPAGEGVVVGVVVGRRFSGWCQVNK